MIGRRKSFGSGAAVVPVGPARPKGKVSPAVLVGAGVGVLGLGGVALLDVESIVGRIMGKDGANVPGGSPQATVLELSAREWDRTLLAIDLGEEGLRRIPLSDSQAYADLDRDGFAERREWFGPEDGLLARDRNGNGAIDTSGELLIGERGGPGAFEALMVIDSDQDGRLTVRDPEFRHLLVWRDLDGNGQPTEGEVRALTSYFVAALEPAESGRPSGKSAPDVRHSGFLRYADGSTVTVYDAGLSSDPGDTAQLVPIGFRVDPEVLQLPVLEGGGRLGSSAVAMSRDRLLRERAAGLVALLLAGDVVTFRREFETYLLQWAGLGEPAAPGTAESAVAFVAAARGVSPTEIWVLLPAGPSAGTATTIAQTYRSMRDAFALSFARQAVELQNDVAARGLSSGHPLSFLVAVAPVSRRPGAGPVAAAEMQSIASGMLEAVLADRLSAENGVAALSLVFSGDPEAIGLDGNTVLLDASTTVLKKETPSEMIARFEADRADIAAAAATMDAQAARLVAPHGARGIWGLTR